VVVSLSSATAEWCKANEVLIEYIGAVRSIQKLMNVWIWPFLIQVECKCMSLNQSMH